MLSALPGTYLSTLLFRKPWYYVPGVLWEEYTLFHPVGVHCGAFSLTKVISDHLDHDCVSSLTAHQTPVRWELFLAPIYRVGN